MRGQFKRDRSVGMGSAGAKIDGLVEVGEEFPGGDHVYRGVAVGGVGPGEPI